MSEELLTMGANPNPRFRCGHCSAVTEVSDHVRAEIPEHGLVVPCWRCSKPLTISAHPSVLAAAQRDHELVGVGMIAAGDVERGKAYLAAHPRP